MAEGPRPPEVPVAIDRAAADRILARALELQSSTSIDPEGGLTEAQLLALASEVGLDPINLRQALAEERTRVEATPEHGLLASLYGRAGVSAQRTVRGTPSQVLKALDDWMQRQEGLSPQRYLGERIVWETSKGLLGSFRRAVSGRGHALLRTTNVGATAIALDDNRVLVRLDASMAGHRSAMAKQSIGLTVAGVAVGTVLAVLHFPILLSILTSAIIAGGGYAAMRSSHRDTVTRAQLGLEQVLDRLERGEAGRPPSLISMLATAVGVRPL